MRMCKIEGCSGRYRAGGYCKKHYKLIPLKDRYKIPSARIRFEDGYIAEPISGCWLWIKTTDHKGYAHIRNNGKILLGHRLAWELHNGPIPEGLRVLHHCDVRCCVNPYHLFLGTDSDNMKDCSRKGRLRGHNHKPLSVCLRPLLRPRKSFSAGRPV